MDEYNQNFKTQFIYTYVTINYNDATSNNIEIYTQINKDF